MSGRAPSRAPARAGTRIWLRRVHLWLGLPLALLVMVSGLTGAALVFYPEIDDALVPALRAVPGDARPASWQAVYDRLRHDHPGRRGPWRIEVPAAGGPIPIRYYDPVETRRRAFAPLMLWLDPRDLTTVRAGFWGEYPTTWLYALHWQLLAGETGETVMGVAGIAMVILLLTGLAAWWPRAGQWRRGLHWKPRAGAIRRLYDLHKLTGVAGWALMLVVFATGVLLALPDQVRPVVARTSPLFVAPRPVVTPRAAPPLPLDTLVARARAVFPGAVPAWIETPRGAAGAVRVNLWQPGEPSRRFPRTNVWLDPYRGTVLAVRDGRRESGGDTLLDWLHPLHSGQAFGTAGRVLALLSGLAAALLAATGLWRWAMRRPALRRLPSNGHAAATGTSPPRHAPVVRARQ